MTSSSVLAVWRRRLEEVRRFGLGKVLWRRILKLQDPVIGYARYGCLVLPSSASPAAMDVQSGYTVREIGVDELEPLLGHPESNLRPKDLARARAEGHVCMGVFDGARLASFSLSAHRPFAIDATFRFEFPEGWIYHYMAVTLPEWRGKRLHALQLPAICRRFAAPGFRGIVALVLTTNYPSLKSFRRIGFRQRCSFAVVGYGRKPRLIRRRSDRDFALVKLGSAHDSKHT